MNKSATLWATALAILAYAGSPGAHHSYLMYATAPIWVRGTVVTVELIDPHTITTIEERSENGRTHRWAVEGPGQSQLDRMGIAMDIPKLGDRIEFCAFPYKSPAELSRIFPSVDFSALRAASNDDGPLRQFVAGHVMLTPDGERRFWEPHGSIGACIQSTDGDRQPWLDFLNSNQSAKQAWCRQRSSAASVEASESLQALVEEIDGLLDAPCP